MNLKPCGIEGLGLNQSKLWTYDLNETSARLFTRECPYEDDDLDAKTLVGDMR